MATTFDFIEDAASPPTQFDFQPDPEESPSARPIIPAPGEPIPRMAKAPPLSPFEAGQIPTRVAQAQAAGPVPELTGAEIEQMVMDPQVTIPNVIPESWPIARGLFQTAKSIPEFVTAPAAPYILMAQQIPLVREAVDAAMGAGMVKSAAELAGEASVTGDREKMAEAISSGVFGATMLGAPHVSPMIANEIAARRVGPPDLARVDVEAFPGPANMIQIPDVAAVKMERSERGVMVPKAREFTPDETEQVFGLERLTEESNREIEQAPVSPEPTPPPEPPPTAPQAKPPETVDVSPSTPTFAQKHIPALESRIGQLHNLLIDSDAFAGSEFYDQTYPIPKQGGIVAAKQSERYRVDPAYAAKVDAAVNDVTGTMVRANRQRLALMGRPESGTFGVDYSVEKVRATYGVNVVRAWHNEAKQKYPYTRRLGNVSVREAFQNSLDAVIGALQGKQIRQGEIKINTESYDNKGFKIDDNGVGMSDVDIGQKFLSLHSTGKAVEGRFGGFGIAKAVILGPADTGTWKLTTRDNYFTHELAQANEFVQTVPKRQGTEIEVTTPEYILDDDARRYVESTELPKNVNVTFDDKPVVNPFKGKKPQRETVKLNDETSYDIAYYPNAPEGGYNQKYLIRLVDPKTGARLTQAIKDIGNEGFNGTVVVDITTTALPGSESYPLVDSRMEMKWGAEKPIQQLIEKHSIDPLSAKRVGVKFTFQKVSNRPEWVETITKIASDPSYKTLSDTITKIWEETGKYFGSTPQRPFTPLSELEIKIDVGHKGYKGGTVFQAKHLAAYESVSRLMSFDAKAPVTQFYGMLSKPVDGGVVNAEHAAGGSMGLNFLQIDKTALKNPASYALYLRDLVSHELTHEYYGPHNEEFTAREIRLQRETAHLFPYILKIAESVLGKESEFRRVVEKRVEIPIEKPTVVEKYLAPEQLKFIYDNAEKQATGPAKDELYYPRPATPGQLEFEPNRPSERPSGFSSPTKGSGDRGTTQQSYPPSTSGPESGGVGTSGVNVGQAEIKPPEMPPTGPGISNGPGAAGYGTPGTYSPISELTDRMATSPVKNLHESIGVGERISDSWARGKDAFSRALGKLRVVPGALKRSWRNVRDLNEVEERVSALDWVLQQSSAKSKIAGETIRKAIPASQVRDAMAIWIDAGGDEAAIRNTLANLPATTPPRVRRALEVALTLPDDVKTHASNLADYYARRAQEAQAEDVLHGVLEDYFTHVWKKPANMPDSVKEALNTGRVNEYFQYSRQRKIPTLLEGILQGKEPVLDPAEVIPHYNYLMDRAIASRRFIKSLEDAKMSDGKPVLGMWGTRAVVGDPGEGAILIKLRGRPEDYNNYRQIDHPALRKWKWAATDEEGRPVFYEGTLAVHPEAYERLARMMDRSRLTAAKVTRALLRVSGEVKGAKLGLLSPFHQVHLGSHALGHWTNPFFNLRAIDWDAPSTQFAVEKAGLKLAPNPAELANFAEGILSPGLVHKIPVIGPISKAYSEWLFTDYLPRLKLKTFENAWARNRTFYDKAIRAGKITEDQLAMRVGDAINNAYGELNQLWLGKHGRDPRVQRALRLGFLAPDFGEARLRFVGKALKAYSLEERLALGTLFATLYLSARVGNILTHGDAEFQDWKHAFAVKQGNRWYSMRSVLGDTLHAFANFPNFLYVRLNPAYARGVMEFFTGRDITGRKRTAGEQVIDELKQVVPIHLGGLTRDDQHVWESFLMAIGVGSQRAAPTVEVSQLASDWRKRRGIESRAETLSDPNSPYRKARIALEFGNRQDFHDAIRELTRQHQARGDRTPRASIRTAFESYYTRPFSGSARLEPAFKASLGTREQRKYQDALIERRRLLQKFRQWY